MSILKVNTIQDKGGNTLLSSDGAGTISSGGLMTNTPAFHAELSSDQDGVSNNAVTKVQIDSEIYDTDGCYDNSTNYRFTPTVAGKYNVNLAICGGTTGGTLSDVTNVFLYLYKNGSEVDRQQFDTQANYLRSVAVSYSTAVDMNGTTDYIEMYCRVNSSGGNAIKFKTGTNGVCSFGAYRIIGA